MANSKNTKLKVGDYVHLKLVGFNRETYKIREIKEDDMCVCVYSEGSYEHVMVLSSTKLKRLQKIKTEKYIFNMKLVTDQVTDEITNQVTD